MNIFLAGCIAFITALHGYQHYHVILYSNKVSTQQVAKDFSYPESPETIKEEVPYEAQSLNGKVIDVTDSGLEKVFVERLCPGWGRRLDATFTDSNGFFSLSSNSKKVQYLKFSKPGFNTLLIKVKLKNTASSSLNVKLGISN